ncbi:MAG: hypothetical protein AAFU65_17145, partial [Pseudomonadota bacterium]
MRTGIHWLLALVSLAAASAAHARGAACVHHPAYGEDPYCLLFGDLDGDGQVEPVQFHAGTFTFGDFGDGPVEIGRSGDYPLLGDWNGDGRDTVGIYRDGQWLLTNSASYLTGVRPRFDSAFRFGGPGMLPVTGDWDGDGTQTAGILDQRGTFTLTDTVGGVRQTLTIATKAQPIGPLAGDFDRDG